MKKYGHGKEKFLQNFLFAYMRMTPDEGLVVNRGVWGDGVKWFFFINSGVYGPIGMKFGTKNLGVRPNNTNFSL